MAANENLSLEQFQKLIEWHGGIASPHSVKGGLQVTLSELTGKEWGMGHEHHMESFDPSHPIVQKTIEESKKYGIL